MGPAMPGGAGVNQRALITMTPAEVETFLHESRVMTMCTLNHDGTIHAVAMWYGFLDGRVAIETKAKSQKSQNLRRNATATCLFEAGDTYDELRGVELVGHFEVVEEPSRREELALSHYRRYVGEYTPEAADALAAMLHKRIVAELYVDRVVSWDHRKLAGT